MMFKRVAESQYGREFLKWYERHGLLKILVRCFAFHRAPGVGGIIGGGALAGVISYQNSERLDKLEKISSLNLKKAEMCYKNMKQTKENLLDCESVKAILSPHQKKKSVKQEGLLILVVEEEETGEDEGKGSHGDHGHPPPARVMLPKSVGPSLSPLPECPFSGSMRFAFLDYYDLPYKVNPISKKELKWSDYKKVPVEVVDGEQTVNSSGI